MFNLPEANAFLKKGYFRQKGILVIMTPHCGTFTFKKSVLIGVEYKSVSIKLE